MDKISKRIPLSQETYKKISQLGIAYDIKGKNIQVMSAVIEHTIDMQYRDFIASEATKQDGIIFTGMYEPRYIALYELIKANFEVNSLSASQEASFVEGLMLVYEKYPELTDDALREILIDMVNNKDEVLEYLSKFNITAMDKFNYIFSFAEATLNRIF